jgi:hypothetical protein
MHYGIPTAETPATIIRYGYYIVAMLTLWLYQLLTHAPISALGHTLPLIYLLSLFLLSKLVWNQLHWENDRPDSLAKRQQSHFHIELSIYILLAVISGMVNTAQSQELSRKIISITQQLRDADLFKAPGIAETLDWGRAIQSMDQQILDEETLNATLGVVLKYQDDILQVKKMLETNNIDA